MSSSSPQDSVAKFDTLLAGADFVFAVVYRGAWCPFCISYLKTLENLAPAIAKSGGTPVIITSQEEQHLQTTRSSSGYAGEAIVDVENQLVNELKKRGLIDITVTKRKGYEHGMAQPAVLVMRKDGTVLEKWAIVPSLMNMGGATDRPSLDQVWANVQSQLHGQEAVHKSYLKMGMRSLIAEKMRG